ncbi:hypothetical protein BCR36DRAFT_410561 [Piromyces finnis]|uniref:PX domain-containing protein n=1 Tax=Piromyces finnis TaxID=1754191 RepID=A0A1Y1VF73_9FUNG|nr:hypothetical protein BCR36DRAFT_410561 [Piromyces finnis]|eukprot:ORX54753.1 hypothetical protein BCR36DRAFT_410561 [Piromyces finnis]
MNTLFDTQKLIESYTKILFKKWEKTKKLRTSFYVNSNDEFIRKEGNDNFIRQAFNSQYNTNKTSNEQKLFYIDVIYQFYFAKLNYQYTYQQIHLKASSQPTPNQNISNTLETTPKQKLNNFTDKYPSLDTISFNQKKEIALPHQLLQDKLTLIKQYLQDIQELDDLCLQLLEKSKLIRSWLYTLKDFQLKLLFYIWKRTNNNNNKSDNKNNSLTSSEINLINEIHLLLTNISNELPCLIDDSQQEKIILKINEYTQYLQNNNKILSFNPHLYYILKNSTIYRDRVNIINNNEKENNIDTLSLTSSKEYYLKYYQQHYHYNNSSIKRKGEESTSTIITNISRNSSVRNYTQEEDSWADITPKSGFSMIKSPQLSEVYKPTIRHSSSLESFPSSQEEEISIENDNIESFYANSDLVFSTESINSNSKQEKGSLPINKLKLLDSCNGSINTYSHTNNTIHNILPISSSLSSIITTVTPNKSLLIPLDNNYNPLPEYHTKNHLTLSPTQKGLATNTNTLTSLSNINSELYHDNSYSEQVNQSKLDLQKFIKDSPMASSRYDNNNNINKYNSLSRLSKANLDINIPTSPSLSTFKIKSPTTPKTPKTPQNNYDPPDISNSSIDQEPGSPYSSFSPPFKPSKPHLLYKNSSFIQSDPTLATSSSSTTTPSTISHTNKLIDLFQVTKPKKVGLNILSQHIEYVVIAQKFGEKDVVGYKRYSDFVKLRDHLYALCQKRSKTKKKSISSTNYKRTSFNSFLKKEKNFDDDRFIAYNEVNLSNEGNFSKGIRKSNTSLEINKLIKTFGGSSHNHNNHQGNNNRSFSRERSGSIKDTFDLEFSLTRQQQQQQNNEEDEMAIINKVLPPFPQKKIVGKFNMKFIEKRRESLQTFLNDILKEPSLDFLIITIKQWITNEIIL